MTYSITVAAQRRAIQRLLKGSVDFVYRRCLSQGRESAIKYIRREVKGVGFPDRPQIYGRQKGILITWHLREEGVVISYDDVLNEVIRIHENRVMEDFF